MVLWLFISCVWDVLGYRILIKTAFFWAKQKLSKKTLSTIQRGLFELWWAWFFGSKKSCFENLLRSLYMKQHVFFVQMQSHVLAALFSLERYVRYFGSSHPGFEMSCDTEFLEKKQFLIFSETWFSAFCIVCNCFDDFCTKLPKNIGRFHRKQNTKFPKRHWLRSKNDFWALLCFFLWLYLKKNVLTTSSELSTWNNTCFLFIRRVTFRLR